MLTEHRVMSNIRERRARQLHHHLITSSPTGTECLLVIGPSAVAASTAQDAVR